MAYNYLYALTYVDFDNENKDVMYFNDDNEKDTYFSLTSLFDSSNKNYFNFEKKNLLDITLTIDNVETNVINKEFGFNYLIIKEVNTSFYYFYFINRINYDNFNKLRIVAHLDIFTTYFDKLLFDGVINRATMREFMKDGTDIIYDTGSYTHVFSVDDTYQGKKFLQNEKTLQPHVYTYLDNSTLDTWLEENVEVWQYIYVDSNHQYKYDNTPYRHTDEFMSDGVIGGYGVIAMPIYKTNRKIIVKFRDISDPNNPHTYNIWIHESSLEYFRNSNNGNEYIYSSKLSKQPPFTPIDSNTDSHNFLCTISTSGNLIMDFGDVNNNDLSPLLQNFSRVFISHEVDSYTYYGMIEYNFQMKRFYNNNVSSFIDDYIKTRFSQADYLNFYKYFYKFPNATSLKNVELKITYNGQEYSTTPSKLDTGRALIEMLEVLNPDISKTYVRWKPTGYYAFRSYNSKTLTGGIFSDDTMITLSNTKLQEVLANSKNFFYQRRVNIGVNGMLNLAQNTAKQDILGLGKSLAKTQLDEINYGFEVDNIENAPSHLEKASGNALFNLLTKDYGLHLEIWMMSAEDLTNIAEYYNRYGIATNTIGTHLDFLNKHKYFDYTEYDVYKIVGKTTDIKISNEIREELKRKLKRGVRFWYSNLYNYTKYNYEVALE